MGPEPKIEFVNKKPIYGYPFKFPPHRYRIEISKPQSHDRGAPRLARLSTPNNFYNVAPFCAFCCQVPYLGQPTVWRIIFLRPRLEAVVGTHLRTLDRGSRIHHQRVSTLFLGYRFNYSGRNREIQLLLDLIPEPERADYSAAISFRCDRLRMI